MSLVVPGELACRVIEPNGLRQLIPFLPVSTVQLLICKLSNVLRWKGSTLISLYYRSMVGGGLGGLGILSSSYGLGNVYSPFMSSRYGAAAAGMYGMGRPW